MTPPQKDKIATNKLVILFKKFTHFVDTVSDNNLIPTIPKEDYNKLKAAIHEFEQKHLTNQAVN